MSSPITPITIDQIKIGAYLDYAEQKTLADEVSKQYPPGQLSSLSGQVRIDSVTPQPTELDLLLGKVGVTTPWALFLAPDILYGKKQRYRVPFGVSSLLPSLGSSEYCADIQQKVLAHPCGTQEEERERHSLDNFFGMLQKLNTWLNDVFNRIHQFMHG